MNSVSTVTKVSPHEWYGGSWPYADRRGVTDAADGVRAAQVYSDHDRLYARSLAMHCLVAKKLLANPSLIAQARSTLARWRAQAREPLPSDFLEWACVLEGRPEEIAAFLASTSEDATRLRQSSLFTDLLTPEERAVIYETFQGPKPSPLQP